MRQRRRSGKCCDYVARLLLIQNNLLRASSAIMPEAAPDGVFPMFLRGVTTEKYGFKKEDALIFKICQISPLKDIIN